MNVLWAGRQIIFVVGAASVAFMLGAEMGVGHDPDPFRFALLLLLVVAACLGGKRDGR